MVASRNKVCKCVRISRYLTSILICSQLPTLVIFLVSKRFMEPLGILVALLGCKRVMRLRVKRHLQQFVVLLCIKIAFLLQYFQRTETAVSAPFVILNYSRTVQVVPTCTLQTLEKSYLLSSLVFYTELIRLAMTSCDMSKLIDIQRKKSDCPMSSAGKYNTNLFVGSHFVVKIKLYSSGKSQGVWFSFLTLKA